MGLLLSVGDLFSKWKSKILKHLAKEEPVAMFLHSWIDKHAKNDYDIIALRSSHLSLQTQLNSDTFREHHKHGLFLCCNWNLSIFTIY